MYDTIIVGAGPAGLQAGIVLAFDGLKVLLIDKGEPGGRILNSPLIENIAGYPVGFNPLQWSVQATHQYLNLGGRLLTGSLSNEVTGIVNHDGNFVVTTLDGHQYVARTVVVASGTDPKKLDIPTHTPHIHYDMVPAYEARQMDRRVMVVGGRNAAGTAAMCLSLGNEVILVSRGKSHVSAGIKHRWGRVRQLEYTTVVDVVYQDGLLNVWLRNDETGQSEWWYVDDVYVFAGGTPSTDFVPSMALSGTEGIRTKPDGETRVPGLFAIGDVRAASVRTMGSALGDGTTVARGVHGYLDRLEK